MRNNLKFNKKKDCQYRINLIIIEIAIFMTTFIFETLSCVHDYLRIYCAFSWHQVVNVGSVRAFYAVINHLVVKRNLHSHERTKLFINYQLVLRIIENIAMCESQAIVETIL